MWECGTLLTQFRILLADFSYHVTHDCSLFVVLFGIGVGRGQRRFPKFVDMKFYLSSVKAPQNFKGKGNIGISHFVWNRRVKRIFSLKCAFASVCACNKLGNGSMGSFEWATIWWFSLQARIFSRRLHRWLCPAFSRLSMISWWFNGFRCSV